MTIAPIVVRLFEPISFIFPEASAAMPPGATVPLPICVLCEGLASPPSRLGWAQTPERQMIFACCGGCADCADQELEEKIRAKFNDTRAGAGPPMVIGNDIRDTRAAMTTERAWAIKAAKDWVAAAQSTPAA